MAKLESCHGIKMPQLPAIDCWLFPSTISLAAGEYVRCWTTYGFHPPGKRKRHGFSGLLVAVLARNQHLEIFPAQLLIFVPLDSSDYLKSPIVASNLSCMVLQNRERFWLINTFTLNLAAPHPANRKLMRTAIYLPTRRSRTLTRVSHRSIPLPSNGISISLA